MNENKWIDSPRITIVQCLDANIKLSRWKCVLNLNYENYNERNCQGSKFSFIDFVLTDRKSLSGKQSKSAMASGKSSRCRFSFLAARIRNFRIRNFRFSFSFNGFLPLLGKFERHCLWAIRIFQCFSCRNRKKIPTNHLVLWIVKALPFIHQPDRVAPKGSDMSATDWRYQTHVKKYRIFSRVLLRLFSGLEMPCMTP